MFDNTWEKVHQETEWGKYPPEEVIRFVARNFYSGKRKEIKILDAGCGAGAISWYVAREGFDLYGFDASETAVKKVRERFTKEKLNGDFSVFEASNTSYQDNYFNSVIDSAMISANPLKGIKEILKEIHRVLIPGGKFFSTGLFKVGMLGYGTGDELEQNTYKNMTEGNLTKLGTIHFFSKDEIEELWVEAGFKNLQIDYLYRTDKGGTSIVEYYIVECQK